MAHWARNSTWISRSKQSKLPSVLVHPQHPFDRISRAAKRGMWIKGKLKETPAEYKKRIAAGGGTKNTAKGK